jgi:hypothetical protein
LAVVLVIQAEHATRLEDTEDLGEGCRYCAPLLATRDVGVVQMVDDLVDHDTVELAVGEWHLNDGALNHVDVSGVGELGRALREHTVVEL